MTGFEKSEDGAFSRAISNAVYSRQSVAAAQAAFKQHCTVSVRPGGNGLVTVKVLPKGEAAKTPRQAVLEFWNFVLDAEAQKRLEME